MNILVGDTLYLTHTVTNGRELWAYQPSSINTQTNTGGTVLSWAINGSLPSGLSFGTNNGTIYGRVTELWIQTSYMVWANNSGGSTVGYLNITVNDLLPTLSYSPNDLVLTRGLQSNDLPLNATLTGVGEITSWEINGSLPAGLNFGPTTVRFGATNRTADIIRDLHYLGQQLRWIIVATSTSQSWKRLQASVTILGCHHCPWIRHGQHIRHKTGIVVTWEISPSLPTGLSFDNGTIYGLPLVNMSSTSTLSMPTIPVDRHRRV